MMQSMLFGYRPYAKKRRHGIVFASLLHEVNNGFDFNLLLIMMCVNMVPFSVEHAHRILSASSQTKGR